MSPFTDALYKTFSFQNPAVMDKLDGMTNVSIFCEDKKTLNARVAIVGIAIIGSMVWVTLTNFHPLLLPLTVLLIFPTKFVVERFESFENKRALSLIHEHAVKIFINEPIIPEETLERFVTSQAAMITLLKQPNLDLNKNNFTNQTLFDKVNNSLKNEVFELFIDKMIETNQFDFDHFIKILGTDNKTRINYIFEKKAIKNFTEEQQFACFNALKFGKNIHLLINQGFNINAKNSQGNTLLIDRLINRDNSQVIRLLQLGAEIPPSDHPVLLELLNDSPLKHKRMIRYFKQAESFRRTIPEKLAEPFKISSWNLLQPAITDSQTYQIGLDERVDRAAKAIFPLMLFAGVYMELWIFPFLSYISLITCYYLYESSRATKALNKLAIHRFNNQPFFDAPTGNYIFRTPQALEELIANNADLTKVNEKGKTLLDKSFSFWQDVEFRYSRFTKLIDALDKQIDPQEKYRYILKIVQESDVRFLEYALSKKWLDISTMNKNEQLDLLLQLKNPQMIPLLRSKGFDLSVQNNQGNNLLLSLLYSFKSENYPYIIQLLKNDVDLNATATVWNEQWSVESYLSDKKADYVIKKLLETKRISIR